MNYEELQKANATIKTTDIKGREYAEVNQRIKAFRMLYPEGTIETEMISNIDGVCVFRAIVSVDGKTLGTGTAYEKESSSYINKTSYIENCETSAVGRALGMVGIGIDTSVASYEEVANAINNQEEKKATPKQLDMLRKYYDEEALIKHEKVNKLEDITLTRASELIDKAMKEKKE